MKQEIADLWVTELRSGNYDQGRHALKEDNKFCCLGVLCEIAFMNGVVDYSEENTAYEGDTPRIVGKYNRSSAFLPEAVIEWAGMNENNKFGRFGIPGEDTLVTMNDNYISFSDIADVIEDNVDKL